jgi:hypothetical protein
VRNAPILALAVLTGLALSRLHAQGVAGAAIEGIAVDSAGRPVAGALVTVRHEASGAEYRTSTDAAGRFHLDVVPAQGAFTLRARLVGRPPVSEAELHLEVGDRLYRRLVFGAEHQEALAEVTVRASPLAAYGGPGYAIPGEGIRALPLFNRDFTGLFAAAPQALGRDLNSISGQHPGYNAIQIDGANGNDVYGVGRTPGALAGAKSISLEALEGLRVLVAPFDVREGGFSGGLINAVTRSGGNRLEGSAFMSLQGPFLVGPDTAGAPAATFEKIQYGFTASGPILRDRLHFFVAVDLQRSVTPFVGPEAGAPGTGVSDSVARRAADVFRTRYGFDAGSPDAPLIHQPDRDLFAKLSWQLGVGSRLELTHNWVDAASDQFNRDVRGRINRDGWALSRSGWRQTALVHATRVRLWTAGGRWSNELQAGYETTAESQTSNLGTPLFLVETDTVPATYLAGGSVVTGQGTMLDQRLFEATDNLTWSAGRHEITVGGRLQLFHVVDNLFLDSWGVWRFPSVDALEQLAPDRYEVNLPLRPGGPVADFGSRSVAAFVQDRWAPTERLNLTVGLRIDIPFMDAPLRNDTLAASDALGRLDTGSFPSGNALLAPRVGVQYDLTGGWRTVLRAGAGVFSGQPPFAWLGGAFSNTGLDQQTLVCTPTAGGVPPPVVDPAQRPSACLGSGGRASQTSSVVAFSRGFRFPQSVKLLLGLDHDFGAGLTASLDLMTSETRHAAYLSDSNLTAAGVSAEGRVMYGTLNAVGVAQPARRDPARWALVLVFEDRSRDRFRALTLTVKKGWAPGGYVELGWQWSRTEDLFTINKISAALTLLATPIDGSLAERSLTRSGYDVPHSLTASGAIPLPGHTTISFLARYQSGRPYAYTVTGDANADGMNSNDLLYVPAGPGDISLADTTQYAALDRFIQSEPCLRTQRGRIMARNSCRNPGFFTLDARVSWDVPLFGRRVEVGADIFNLPNLLNGSWGLIRQTSAGEGLTGLLSVVGWDAARGRPVYALAPVLPAQRQVLLDVSRWRIQLGSQVRL